jgi:integrase/recombinase XerD
MTANEIIVRPVQAIDAAPEPLGPEAQLVSMWLHGLSRHTKRAYSHDLNLFRQSVPKRLGEITLLDIQTFADCLDAMPLCAGTRHRTLSAVKSFFTYAHRLGLMPNVAAPLRMPSGKDTLNERILTEQEVVRLIEACEPPRDRLIAEMLYYCGLRVSELVGLDWPSARGRPHGGQITVLGKGNKTRTVLVPDFLFNEVCAFEPPRGGNGLIFPISASQVGRVIAAAAKKAGISKPVSPHWLRHCHCSHALERGADLALIQATVGHSNIATTSRYLHARPDRSSSSFLPRPAQRA